jgi:dihydropteridine reductase
MKSKVGLIVGGSGALGSNVITVFKRHGWKLLNLDTRVNDTADANILISTEKRLQEQVQEIHARTKSFNQSFDSIICTAGGFEAGTVRDFDVLEKYERLDRMNAQSALLAGHLAAHYLGEQGFLCLTGAAKVFEGPVNWAYAYGITKQATHAMVLHLAERVDIPKSSSVCCILPTMIDTEANRDAMPNEDTSSWLPPEKVGELLRSWAEGENRPENGSFAKLNYKNQCVVPEFI